jgi:hypothetical protein
MSCDTSTYSPVHMNYFLNNKTFYNVHFKDTTHAFVLKDTLLNVIKYRMQSIESIVKFNYDNELHIHMELLLFADHMKIFGDEYIKTYENLHEMYGSNPLDDFDKKIIIQLNLNDENK